MVSGNVGEVSSVVVDWSSVTSDELYIIIYKARAYVKSENGYAQTFSK